MDKESNDKKGTRMSESRDQSSNVVIKGRPSLIFVFSRLSVVHTTLNPTLLSKVQACLMVQYHNCNFFFQSKSSLKLTTGARVL